MTQRVNTKPADRKIERELLRQRETFADKIAGRLDALLEEGDPIAREVVFRGGVGASSSPSVGEA